MSVNLSYRRNRFTLDNRVKTAVSSPPKPSRYRFLRSSPTVVVPRKRPLLSQSRVSFASPLSPAGSFPFRFSRRLVVTRHFGDNSISNSAVTCDEPAVGTSFANSSVSCRKRTGPSRFYLIRKPRRKNLCLFYHRYGRCVRGDNCPYIHNPEKIAVCSRFLRGKCAVDKCPFSHKLSKAKMPVCSFFLKGLCFKADCPYLHVKHRQSAALCKDFAAGFCAKGEECDCLHQRYQHKRLVLRKGNKPRPKPLCISSLPPTPSGTTTSASDNSSPDGPLPEFIRLPDSPLFATPQGKSSLRHLNGVGNWMAEVLIDSLLGDNWELSSLVPSFLRL